MPKGVYKKTKEHCKNLSKAKKGKHTSPKTEFKKGHPDYLSKENRKEIGMLLKGRKLEPFTKEHIEKIKETSKGKHYSPETEFKKGKKHIGWLDGKSFEPYGISFNNILKLKIRKRDNFTCQECNFTEKQLGYKLGIHHIDYDKQNNNPDNLITLCRNCHAKTNYKREDWTNYFQNKLL